MFPQENVPVFPDPGAGEFPVSHTHLEASRVPVLKVSLNVGVFAGAVRSLEPPVNVMPPLNRKPFDVGACTVPERDTIWFGEAALSVMVNWPFIWP